jgi:iron complex transport system substrate-binding protein
MIELAGGTDALGEAGVKSRTVTWGEIGASNAELAVVMPCGLYVDEAAEQVEAYREQLAAIGARRIVAVDAASSFSRPGPRLVDGVELLAHLVHPASIDAPAGIGWREATWASLAPSSG